MKIKIQKFRFARDTVEYLGHIISHESIKADPKKLQAVKEFPMPQNLDILRSFLGFANYYRKFVDQFAEKAHTLTELTKSKVSWKWGTEEQTCFERIKKYCAPLLSSRILTSPSLLSFTRMHANMELEAFFPRCLNLRKTRTSMRRM
jgi:hypothetical protein